MRNPFLVFVLWVIATWGSSGAAWAVEAEEGEYDWGFIASSFDDVNGDRRTRGLGPFLESTTSGDGKEFLAVRPAYCRVRDPASERTKHEMVWPIATAKSFKEEFSWRFLSTIYLNFDVNDPDSRYRFWVFPLYYQGRDKVGDSYLGVFPLGGTVHEFLSMDRIAFALFPLWAKNSIGDVKSKHLFWPIYSRTTGKGIYRFRVFPFYGQARFRDHYNKKFVMWPLWTSAIYAYPDSSGSAWMLFPVAGHIDLEREETWFVVPPLFKFAESDRQKVVNAPWPLVQYASGKIEKIYLFPIWGKKTMAGSHRTFFLWPIFRRDRIDKGDSVYHRFRAMPFVYSDVYRLREPAPDAESDVASRYLKIWPLFSYRQEGDARRFRVLDLWLRKNRGPVERNFAPFWTLYSRTEKGDVRQSELLWGLYRHHRIGEEERYLSVFPFFSYLANDEAAAIRSFSIFKGLLGYRRSGTDTRYQALWLFKWGDEESEP